MKSFKTKGLFFILVLFLFSAIAAPSAIAKPKPISFAISGDMSGLALSYDLRLLGSNNIQVNPNGTPATLPFAAGSLTISINEIKSDPPTIDAHFRLDIVNVGTVYDQDIPLPFFDLALDIDPSGRTFTEPEGDNNIEISLLYTNNKFQYDIIFDLFTLISDRWKGEADRINNKIEEEVIIDLSGRPDTDRPVPDELRLDLTIIPVFNISRFSPIGVAFDVYKDGSPAGSYPGAVPVIGEIGAVPVPVPKGSSRLKIDLGFDTYDDLIEWIMGLIPELEIPEITED
jgi:hypothetical protein